MVMRLYDCVNFFLQSSFCKQLYRINTRILWKSKDLNWFVSNLYWQNVPKKFTVQDLVIKPWSFHTTCSRIDGSNLTGKIPDFIGNWTNLTRLWVLLDSIKLSSFSFANSIVYIFFHYLIHIGSPAETCRVHQWMDLFLLTSLCWWIWKNCEHLIPPVLNWFIVLILTSYSSITESIFEKYINS